MTKMTKKPKSHTITPGVIRAVRKSKTLKFFLDNWFISIFFACIAFVGVVSFSRLFVKQENFVYARVKLSQGLWWASTQKPPSWLVQSLKEGMVERDLAGEPKSKLLSVRAYPYYSTSQYDTYLDLKLKVSGKLKTGTVNFNRSTLAVGSPIELAFPKAEITGTVMELSSQPLKDKLVWQEATLVKNNGYLWEYDAIEVGDFYHDGEERVFEVVSKQLNENPSYYLGSNLGVVFSEPRYIITVRAKIKTRPDPGGPLYGFEQDLKLGKTVNISTNHFYFQDFRLASLLK